MDNGSEDSVLESFVYTYDKNSQILTCRHTNNLPAEDKRIDETRSYTYDSYGQLTESIITDHNNSDAQSVTTYTYDKVGNRTAMTRDGKATAYTYNGLNQLTEAETEKAIINGVRRIYQHIFIFILQHTYITMVGITFINEEHFSCYEKITTRTEKECL